MSIKRKYQDGHGGDRRYVATDIEHRRDGTLLAVGLAYWNDQGRQYDVFKGPDCQAKMFKYYYGMVRKHPSKGSNKYLRNMYAHNGANYDYLSFFTDYSVLKELGDPKVKFMHSNGSGIGGTIKLPNKYGSINLRDSLRLMPASLKKLSKTLAETQYQKIDLGDEHPEDTYERDRSLFYDYLQNDCLANQEIVAKFHEYLNGVQPLDQLGMTLGSTSLSMYRSYFMPEEEILTPWSDSMKNFERAAFVGGRTECFRRGYFPKVYVTDVNSMYPYAMLHGLYPMSYKYAPVSRFHSDRPGIYRIRFKQYRRDIPPVLLVMGNGAYEGEGSYCSPEIQLLLEVDPQAFIHVYEGRKYWDVGRPFVEFVSTLYQKRREAMERNDDGMALVIKLLLNNLYGKWAERNEGSNMVLPQSKEEFQKLWDANKGHMTVRTETDWVELDEYRHVEHQWFGWASLITSYARACLYRYMMEIGDVLYCDTDSVHSLNEPSAYMMDQYELGKLKLEFVGEGAYVGKKLYGLRNEKETKLRHKGIPMGYINYDMMVQAARDPLYAIKVEFMRPPSFRGVLQEGLPANVWRPQNRTVGQVLDGPENKVTRHGVYVRSDKTYSSTDELVHSKRKTVRTVREGGTSKLREKADTIRASKLGTGSNPKARVPSALVHMVQDAIAKHVQSDD